MCVCVPVSFGSVELLAPAVGFPTGQGSKVSEWLVSWLIELLHSVPISACVPSVTDRFTYA